MTRSYEKPGDYRLHLANDATSTSLDVYSSAEDDGTIFHASLRAPLEPDSQIPGWKTAYQHLNPPDDKTDLQTYSLAAPNGKWGNKISLGLSERFSNLGSFSNVITYLGYLYGESDAVEGDFWRKDLALCYPPLATLNERTTNLFEPNGLTFTETSTQVYGAEYFESFIAGERPSSTAPIWGVHDIATHNFGESSLGPTIINLRKKTFKEILHENRRDPNPAELSRLLLRDDALSDSVNKAALRLKSGDPMHAFSTIIHWYLNDPALIQTTAVQEVLSGSRAGERHSPAIMEMAHEVKTRLATAAERLELLNA